MPVQIESICTLVQVYDMLESLRFYQEHLGFEIARQAPLFAEPYPHINWVMLRRGNAELMLNTAFEADRRPASRDPAWVAAHRDTAFFFACPDVDAAYEALKSSNLSPKPPIVTHYGRRQRRSRDAPLFSHLTVTAK
jgi:glyoxylase I family protein